MVQYGRPSRSSWTESVRSSLAGLFWERQFEKILSKYDWEKVPNWECLFCTTWKGNILFFVCGWLQIGWKETKSWSDVEITQQRSRFGRTNIFHGSWIVGMLSTTMRNKQRFRAQLQNHVRIVNFSGENRKTSILSKSSYFFMVFWYGGTCKMCGTILWVGQEDDSTTLQSIHSLHRWPPLWRRRK